MFHEGSIFIGEPCDGIADGQRKKSMTVARTLLSLCLCGGVLRSQTVPEACRACLHIWLYTFFIPSFLSA